MIIQAPDSTTVVGGIFLAGGITDCPDWQAEMAQTLSDKGLIVFNPRRNHFPPEAGKAQIEWEHRRLSASHQILFWFPEETLCPITLFELGRWSYNPQKEIFIGCHAEYKRKFDVEVQMGLVRPQLKIHGSLGSLVDEVSRIAEDG